MLKPNKDQLEAIRRLYEVAPSLFEAFAGYIEAARNHEREMLEECEPQYSENFKGRARMLSEALMVLRGLLPKR